MLESMCHLYFVKNMHAFCIKSYIPFESREEQTIFTYLVEFFIICNLVLHNYFILKPFNGHGELNQSSIFVKKKKMIRKNMNCFACLVTSNTLYKYVWLLGYIQIFSISLNIECWLSIKIKWSLNLNHLFFLNQCHW